MSNLEITLLIILIIIFGLLLTTTLIIFIQQKKNKTPKEDSETKIRYHQELLTTIELLQQKVVKDLETASIQTKLDLKEELSKFKEQITTKVQENMTNVNEKVETRLKEGFKSTDQLFNKINERLSVIDNSQKNIEKLNTNVDELNNLLSDKKLRGIFGEQQLNQILDNIFGENSKEIFEKQKKLSNGTIVDAAIYGPEGVGIIPIDSKFPLENYLLMNNQNASADERYQAVKDFKQNIKKHIEDISTKYIIQGETANQALLFLPAEAIFIELHSKFPELIEFAQTRHVWVTSPSTFVYMLKFILIIASNVAKEKNALQMRSEIEKLFNDFRLIFERFYKLKNLIEATHKGIHQLETPLSRLNKKVYKIENSAFDQIETEDQED